MSSSWIDALRPTSSLWIRPTELEISSSGWYTAATYESNTISRSRLQLAFDDEVETEPEHERRTRRGDRVHDEAEERLSDSELHALVDRGLPLLSEPPELVPSRPNVTITRSIAIASCTIESDCHSSPCTRSSRGTIRLP